MLWRSSLSCFPTGFPQREGLALLGIESRPAHMFLALVTVLVLTIFAGARVLGTMTPSAAIIFNPQGSHFSFSANILNGQAFTRTLGPSDTDSPSYSVSATRIFTAIGMADTEFTVTGAPLICGILSLCHATYVVKLPRDLPDSNCTYQVSSNPGACAPTGAYGVTIGLGGSGFTPVNASSGEAQGFPKNPDGSIINPYPIAQTFKSVTTLTNSSGTWTMNATKTVTWYVGRYLFTVTLNSPGSSAVGVSCVSSLSNSCNPYDYCTSIDDCSTQLRSALGAKVGIINSVSLLSNSRLSVQINIPATWINTNLDWFGIYGAWAGLRQGQGLGGSCTASSCNSGLSDHGVFGIYKDPGLTQGAFSTFAEYEPISNYTADQLSRIVPGSLSSKVYVPVSIASFGTTFSVSGAACMIVTLSSCFASTSDAVMIIPVIFDVIGTKSVFQVSYVPVNPVTSGGGTVSGKVLDGGDVGCFFGTCGPLRGVSVTDGPPCNSVACAQAAATTGMDGVFSITGLTAGSHLLYFSAVGYNPAQQSVSVSQGETSSVGTVLMSPTQGTGTVCLIPPSPNPVPGQPPLIGGICPPAWFLLAIVVIVMLSIGGVIVVLVQRVPFVKLLRLGRGWVHQTGLVESASASHW
ncbi:carboxypeptidase-like regulatory domain-containing protein [Candidatus Bathyarchaeota archaeon]|nr:MAG: carboxypeptidase-like regulatory domain-containing protein [Candidatus Bathyarchaeota archaeon]